jgi:hypothetical protein
MSPFVINPANSYEDPTNSYKDPTNSYIDPTKLYTPHHMSQKFHLRPYMSHLGQPMSEECNLC